MLKANEPIQRVFTLIASALSFTSNENCNVVAAVGQYKHRSTDGKPVDSPVTPAKKIAAVAAFMCKFAMRFCAALIPLLPMKHRESARVVVYEHIHSPIL